MVIHSYRSLSDRELVSMILNGNEEVFLFLLYDRYKADVLYHVTAFGQTDYYYEDIISLVYKSLRGNKQDWSPLSNFQWKCKFRTWLNKIIYNECCQFFKKKIEMVKSPSSLSIEDSKERGDVLVLLEAIARLQDEDGRFILLRVLEGYSSKEIAVLLEMKRRSEGRIKRRPNGDEIIPSAGYVDNYKKRSLLKIKANMKAIKEELL